MSIGRARQDDMPIIVLQHVVRLHCTHTALHIVLISMHKLDERNVREGAHVRLLLTFWRQNYFLFILSHPVYKM